MISKTRQTEIAMLVAAYLPALQVHQGSFRTKVLRVEDGFEIRRGRYWQGLTVGTKAEGATKGLEAAWPTLPTTMPCTMRVDPYEGAQGHGWIIYAQARDTQGILCQRAWDMGPEGRSQGWKEIKDA